MMRTFAVSAAGAQAAQLNLEIPEPAPGEARVRVTMASVNGFDVAVAAGYMVDFFEHRYPVVPGREFAGVVDAVDESVDSVAVGDRVFGVVAKAHLAEGAFAEYTTVDAAGSLARTPASLTDAEAAGLGHTGSTALAIMAALGDLAGRTVLIVGATGGVGTLLVQLAAAAGATVIATGRTEQGRAVLTGLGAAHAVDYSDLTAAVRSVAPDGVDAAVHLAGDAAEIAPLIVDGGTLASALLYAPQLFPDGGRITPAPIDGSPTAESIGRLAELVEQGRLRVIVDREHEFSQIHEAFAHFGRETVGNLVVLIG